MSTALAVLHGPFGRASLFQLNRPLAVHAHREGHLIFRLEGSRSAVVLEEGSVALERRSAAAINPWQPHAFAPGDERRGGVYLTLYINPGWFLSVGRSARSALRFGSNEILVGGAIDRLVRRVTDCLTGNLEREAFDGYLYELTRACFDQSWQWDGPVRDDRAPGPRDYRIRKSIRLMGERIGEDIVLDDVAREAGLSRPHFYKLFRETIGLTPNMYMNILRIERSIDRLTRSDDAVTTIGLDLGFSSQASFTRFFATNTGIPPTDYRRAAHAAS